MQGLNYHHLMYFWVVAREGSITRAGEVLAVAQPTISGQLHALEDSLGEKLFERVGRGLQLTGVGRVVYRYADEIFALGRELQETLAQQPTGRPLRFAVGVSDALPRRLAFQLLAPLLGDEQPLYLVCRRDRHDRLLAALEAHELELMLTEQPLDPAANKRAHAHRLGECDVTLLGTPALLATLRGETAGSLHGAPFLLPGQGSALHHSLRAWFVRTGVQPAVQLECDDGALLKLFAQEGRGLFAAPTVSAAEIAREHQLEALQRVPSVRTTFYAIAPARKLTHPVVGRLFATVRPELFGPELADA